MKSLFKFSLSILALSVLSACSGGSSSSEAPAPAKTPIINNGGPGNSGGGDNLGNGSGGGGNPSDPPKDEMKEVPEVLSYSGVWSGSSYQPTAIASKTNEDKKVDVNVIEVDGVSLNLLDLARNIAPEGITDSYVQSNNAVTYGRFINQNKLDKDKDPMNYLFVYGQETAQDKMPTGGSFTYLGTATYGSEALAGYINNAVSNLKVDFGANTVSGTISHTQRGINVTLPTATISGNSFSGRAGHEGNAFVSGKFYGAGASQLGGVFGDNGPSDLGGGYAGAFSATKQ